MSHYASHPEPPPVPDSPSRADRLALFCFLFSAYLSLHQLLELQKWLHGSRLAMVINAAAFVVAVAATINPRSIRLFALACGLAAIKHWAGLPVIPNHALLTLFVCLTILVALAGRVVSSGRRIDRAATYDDIAPALRLELLAMYFWVVLHKLNWDYLNPTASCGAEMYLDVARSVPLGILPTGEWVRWPSLIGALVLEAAIPLMLVIPKTRAVGIFVGMGFHFILSLHPNPHVFSYSMLLIAFYALFLPDWLFIRIRSLWGRSHLIGLLASHGPRVLAVTAASATIGLTLFAQLSDGERVRQVKAAVDSFTVARWVWYVTFGLVMGVLVVAITGVGQSRPAEAAAVDAPAGPRHRPVTWLCYVFPLLVLLNGSCPYIGLKTGTSFAMFSNLRTENQMTNHLFLPVRYRVAGYQDDVIEIIGSTDAGLASYAGSGRGLVYFEFRRRLAHVTDPNFRVRIRRGSQVETISLAKDPGHEAFQKAPWIERKLLSFRDVQLGPGPQRCEW